MTTQAGLQNDSSRHRIVRSGDAQRSAGLLALVGSGLPKVAPIGFRRNAAVYREGDPVGQLYKVVSGAVRTCRVLIDGRREVGAFYLPGDMFGLETEARHPFSAEAVVNSQVVIVKSPTAPFEQWNFQEASQTWELMRRELIRTRDRALLLGKTAHGRVTSFLLEMAERTASSDQIELPMSRQDIADYLCLRIETVSRMLSQLESEAVIAVAGSKRIMLRKRQKNMRKTAAALGSVIGSVALLWVAATMAQAPGGKDVPTVVKGQPASAMRGIWQSRGYGYVVSVDRGAPKIFRRAGSLCYAEPSKPDPDRLLGFYRPFGQGSIAFSNEQGETLYVFDQLKELPRACTDTAPWSQSCIAAFVAATFADYYPSFQQRGIDWTARVAAAEPSFSKITDDAGLFEAIKSLLAGIEDQHVKLHADVNGEKLRFSPGEGATLSAVRAIVGDKVMDKYEWLPSYKRNVLDTILQGKGHEVANQKLYWGRVGDIGYVNLLSMEELSPSEDGDKIAVDAALDAAIAAFAGTRAVIVDVTYNRGGYDSVSRRAAGRFAESERLAYTKVAFGARDVPPQPFYATPSKRARYLGPVYLLTSDVTVSAGEIFTLLMRALPNVVHVGGTTRGALSDTTEVRSSRTTGRSSCRWKSTSIERDRISRCVGFLRKRRSISFRHKIWPARMLVRCWR